MKTFIATLFAVMALPVAACNDRPAPPPATATFVEQKLEMLRNHAEKKGKGDYFPSKNKADDAKGK